MRRIRSNLPKNTKKSWNVASKNQKERKKTRPQFFYIPMTNNHDKFCFSILKKYMAQGFEAEMFRLSREPALNLLALFGRKHFWTRPDYLLKRGTT